jgi:hypothetical protein
MPVSRGPSFVERALASVLSQDLQDLEVIMGDETGAAEPIVQAAADPRVHYQKNPQRLGLVGNHLALLNQAKGAYHAVLHDDDWWEPTYLSTLVSALEHNPHAGLACCGTVLEWVGDGDVRTEVWPVTLRPGQNDQALDVLLREEWFLLPTATIWRSEVWTGPAVEWPELRCADLQFFLSAADAGWSIWYTPEKLTHWVQHEDQSGAWRGTDEGLGVAEDVIAFWDGWLQGRSSAEVSATAPQRANWYLRRARALLLAGRVDEARRDIAKASELGGANLPIRHRLQLASRLPPLAVRAAIAIKRMAANV